MEAVTGTCPYCLDEVTFQTGKTGEKVKCQCGGVVRLFVDPEDGTVIVDEARCPHGVEVLDDADPADLDVGQCDDCDKEMDEFINGPIFQGALAKFKNRLN